MPIAVHPLGTPALLLNGGLAAVSVWPLQSPKVTLDAYSIICLCDRVKPTSDTLSANEEDTSLWLLDRVAPTQVGGYDESVQTLEESDTLSCNQMVGNTANAELERTHTNLDVVSNDEAKILCAGDVGEINGNSKSFPTQRFMLSTPPAEWLDYKSVDGDPETAVEQVYSLPDSFPDSTPFLHNLMDPIKQQRAMGATCGASAGVTGMAPSRGIPSFSMYDIEGDDVLHSAVANELPDVPSVLDLGKIEDESPRVLNPHLPMPSECKPTRRETMPCMWGQQYTCSRCSKRVLLDSLHEATHVDDNLVSTMQISSQNNLKISTSLPDPHVCSSMVHAALSCTTIPAVPSLLTIDRETQQSEVLGELHDSDDTVSKSCELKTLVIGSNDMPHFVTKCFGEQLRLDLEVTVARATVEFKRKFMERMRELQLYHLVNEDISPL